MEWVTIYDIGQPQVIIWDEVIIVGICLLIFLWFFLELNFGEYYKKENARKRNRALIIVCLLIGIGMSCVIFDWFDYKVMAYNPYEKAYNEGDYEIAEGIPEDVNWHRSNHYVRFTVDGIRTDAVDFRTIKGEHDAKNWLDGNNRVRVYYYAEETDDPYNQAYWGIYWVFRVDVLMEQENAG